MQKWQTQPIFFSDGPGVMGFRSVPSVMGNGYLYSNFFFFCDFLKLRILVNTRPITNLLNHFFKHPKPILILKFLSIQIKCNTRPMLILNNFIKNWFFWHFSQFLFSLMNFFQRDHMIY